MIVHQRRHDEVRQLDRAGLGEPEEAVVLDLRLERTIGILAPVRDQLVEPGRIDHGAGENMRTDLGALLHHHDIEIGIDSASRIAAARPEGPAPTMTTSNSMDLRGEVLRCSSDLSP